MSVQLATRQDEDFPNRVIDVELRDLGLGLPGQGADAPDDVARAVAVPDDAFRGLSRLVEIRSVIRKPAQTGMAVGDHGGERLIDLVSDRCRELAHRRQPCHPCKIRLRVAQRFLAPLALGDVHRGADILIYVASCL